jgi:hypothetical protein
MDSACHVWQDICGTSGHCWIYEKTSMGVKLFVWWIIVKIVAFAFYFAAQYFYEPPSDDNDNGNSVKDGAEPNDVESDEKIDLTFQDEIECKESVI